jgi:2-amino-4-hydroxy-6-hydroxymethyldihydropteridine diphosphokinase
LDRVDATRVVALSRVRETAPQGGAGPGWFLNAVAEVETTLDARSLLDRCLAIETAHGRDRRLEGRWGARTLDLDLLLYGLAVIHEPGLEVPHPRLHERVFVLEPLADLAPDLVHPVLGVSIARLLQGVVRGAGPPGPAESSQSPSSPGRS